MRDLYKKLGIGPGADKVEVRAALATADGPTAAAASTILLNDRRRPVYDRNHRLLNTIGRLRSRLGVNLSPFWARGACADFTEEAPAEEKPTPRKQDQEIDSLIVNRAFGKGRHRRRLRTLRNREILLAAAGGVLSLIFLALVMFFVQWAS